MGRSPVLASSIKIALLSLLRTISPDAGNISPGIMSACLWANWIVKAHELGSIGKRCFHLDLLGHFGNPFHNLIARQDLAAVRPQFGNRLAVACSFQDEICYERHTLGIVELDASCEPSPSDDRRQRDHKLVFFTRC